MPPTLDTALLCSSRAGSDLRLVYAPSGIQTWVRAGWLSLKIAKLTQPVFLNLLRYPKMLTLFLMVGPMVIFFGPLVFYLFGHLVSV